MQISSRDLGILIAVFAFILLFIMLFIKKDFDKESVELCKQLHGDVADDDFEPCPLHRGSHAWTMIFSFVVITLLLALGFYLAVSNRALEARKGAGLDIGSLGKDESVIVERIKEAGGSIYQSDLIRKTGFSKVKITRVLDKLESNGILERKRRGMTNIIVLR